MIEIAFPAAIPHKTINSLGCLYVLVTSMRQSVFESIDVISDASLAASMSLNLSILVNSSLGAVESQASHGLSLTSSLLRCSSYTSARTMRRTSILVADERHDSSPNYTCVPGR